MGIIGFEFTEVYPGGFSKNSRILAMFKALAAGEVFVDPAVREEVFLQITQFNPLKRDNVDDILDLLTYANKVLEMYGEYVVSMNVLVQQDNAGIAVLPPGANTPF
jgi:hypothetical protein